MTSTSLIDGTRRVKGNVTTEERIEYGTEGAKFLVRKVKITYIEDNNSKMIDKKREVLEEKVLADFS